MMTVFGAPTLIFKSTSAAAAGGTPSGGWLGGTSVSAGALGASSELSDDVGLLDMDALRISALMMVDALDARGQLFEPVS
jgi:hypothetical protein